MSAIVHFTVFASDGVIESAATGMPGATDFVEKDNERKPIVKGASGLQRFACGTEASKWWGKKDAKNVLHVASGEPERVSCEACKKSPEYLAATGQPAPSPSSPSSPASPSTPPSGASNGSTGTHEGSVQPRGEAGPVADSGSDVSPATSGGAG